MPRLALPLILALFAFHLSAETGDRLLRLSGSTFSLEVIEPEGWKLATRAALQIANFIFYPEGTDWRRADAVIYVRFVRREEAETREGFIEASEARFREECSLIDSEEETPPLRQEISAFLVEELRCRGIREEMIAVTEVPGFFVVFSLSSQTGTSIDQSIPVLKRILQSFSWQETGEEK